VGPCTSETEGKAVAGDGCPVDPASQWHTHAKTRLARLSHLSARAGWRSGLRWVNGPNLREPGPLAGLFLFLFCFISYFPNSCVQMDLNLIVWTSYF
jgi:hypothetical protein